jgi:hypothetical protein
MFKDGISSIPGEIVTLLWLGRHFLVCENSIYQEKVTIGFWTHEDGMGQHVAQLHDRYMMMKFIPFNDMTF